MDSRAVIIYIRFLFIFITDLQDFYLVRRIRIVKALVDGEWKALADVTAAGEYELVAIAPNALYTVADGVNTASSITIQKATYTIVLKDGYYIDNGEILNATAGFGYQLVVEGRRQAPCPVR